MMWRALVLALLAAACLTAGWLLGYRDGRQTGAFHLLREMDESFELDRKSAMDMDRDGVCNEIRRYKLSIARDLDENTQICGWPDMDGPENSN